MNFDAPLLPLLRTLPGGGDFVMNCHIVFTKECWHVFTPPLYSGREERAKQEPVAYLLSFGNKDIYNRGVYSGS